MPAQPRKVLMKPPKDSKKFLSEGDQLLLRTGIGKLLWHMQYLQPGISQAVHDLARQMMCGDKSYMDAMLQCMQYLQCIKDVGLLLKPERNWDGSDNFFFKINGRSDSYYAKDTQTRQSISGYVIYPEGAPLMHRSATQMTVALSSCEVELNAAVLCIQNMMYNSDRGYPGLPLNS